MSNNKEFIPNWSEQVPPEGSYRSILKWGDPNVFKHPNKRLYTLMKETFGLDDTHFASKQDEGLEQVAFDQPIQLSDEQIKRFKEICGEANVLTDDYERLAVGYGKTMVDLLRLRKGIVDKMPDLVLHPRDGKDISQIVKYCHEQKIPVYIYGGGSSVTRGVEAVKGGVTLDMRVHMNKVVSFNETNQTITVQAGMMGPVLETVLNEAPSKLGAKKAYTCGHFPQSFEYSSVGGWVVTRGAGQNSTYYGNIKDIVISQRYVTPVGEIETKDYPAMAMGPDINHVMMGSEGCYGVLVDVTLKVFRHTPETAQRFSFIFKSWEDGMAAAREILQAEIGHPSAFRLSDPEETDVALKLYGIEGTVIDKAMALRGYKKGERCIFLGMNNGHRSFSKNVKRQIRKICRRHGAMYTTGYVAKRWEHGRFTDPYLREDLQDHGIMIDTLECSVTWDTMAKVHKGVRAYCKSRPKTICMTHLSHAYAQGANLYFIFITKMDQLDDYLHYQQGILDSIHENGASMSHHHGIGKMSAPWLESALGSNELDILKALKQHFDPHNIMNPGGTLALDLPPEERRKHDL